VIVDPYQVFFKTDNFHSGTANKRYIKTKYVLSHPEKYDSFIFGSSRVNYFHPTNFTDGNFYNMSYGGGLPPEHLEDIRCFLNNGIRIKNLVIGIDFYSLLHNPAGREENLLNKKYPDKPAEMINFYSTYLFNKPDMDFIDRVRWMRDQDLISVMETGIFFGDEDKKLNSDLPAHHEKSVFTVPYRGFTYTADFEQNIRVFADLVALAKENDISLTFFINPIFRLTYLNIDFPEYFEALYKLAKITDFYDFGGLNAITSNNYFYYENSHYTTVTSDLIIERLENPDNEPEILNFGDHITHENIGHHISVLQNQLLEYFDATDLNNEYAPPAEFSQNQNHDKICDAKISYINGEAKSGDTLVISSEILYLQGFLNHEIFPPGIFIKIDEKFFKAETVKTDKGKQKVRWFANIPVRHIGPGVHQVEILSNGKETSHNSNTQFIKVIWPKHKFLDLKQTALTSIEVSVPLLNEYSISPKVYYPPESNDLFYIEAHLPKNLLNDPPNGIIAAVDDHWYLSQFSFTNGPPHLIRQGVWGVKVPTWIFEKGVNRIDLFILNNQNDSIFKTENDLQVIVKDGRESDFLEGLPKGDCETLYNLDVINGVVLDLQSEQSVEVTGRFITLSGWAVDRRAGDVAAGVVIIIDGQQFVCDYGMPRPDVAEVFDNQNYLNSGWRIAISTAFFENSHCKLEMVILFNDGKAYYSTSEKLNLMLR
jgi:hypothetical protein